MHCVCVQGALRSKCVSVYGHRPPPASDQTIVPAPTCKRKKKKKRQARKVWKSILSGSTSKRKKKQARKVRMMQKLPFVTRSPMVNSGSPTCDKLVTTQSQRLLIVPCYTFVFVCVYRNFQSACIWLDAKCFVLFKGKSVLCVCVFLVFFKGLVVLCKMYVFSVKV